ncbi:hypothetical protein [Anaerotignum sp.]|uniref:hypothetical protein n=1 Tax=Anaerotignum sp. TaxID=2039241 RepID=UPI0027152FFB|nr:hypothetical protein [Anaerotignum sp.]
MNLNLQLNGTPEEIAEFFLSLFGEPDKEKVLGFIPHTQGCTEAEKALLYQRIVQGW